ncbi:MAG: hypothetical protein OEU95_03215, partial [Nitrospirota bacterium]|nr:hypothetical protein [Nitrospirota bacterium]
FILQRLAFRKKDLSMTDTGLYALDDLAGLAKESGALWAVELIEGFLRIRSESDPVNLFLFAVSVPYRSYQVTGRPVLVMLDDFHKIRKFCELNAAEGDRTFWTLFGKAAGSQHVPHIFSGLDAELDRMFFEDTSFGDRLEIINVPGLNREDSLELFRSLCGAYGLETWDGLSGLIDVFGGNPSYIRNFISAARQAGRVINEEDFWLIYLNEVLRGKTYKYWESILKKHVPQYNLRKPSLRFLYHLSGDNAAVSFDNPGELFPDGHEDLRIMDLLHGSGAIMPGFSEVRLAEDEVMADVIKGLYCREILKEPHDRIREVILGDRLQYEKNAGTRSFDITIPAEPKAELIAVRSLEEIARHFNVPLEATGQMQIALVELIANVLARCGPSAGGHHLRFGLNDRTFYIEITTASKECVLTDENYRYIGEYLDDIMVESLASGTKITFNKELVEDIV